MFRQSPQLQGKSFPQYYALVAGGERSPGQALSFFDVNNDAWKYDSLTKSYFLHYFSQKQPDLNWENPIEAEIFSMMKFCRP